MTLSRPGLAAPLVRDAHASGSNSFGDLPEWNLDDLYKGEDAPELTRDMDWLRDACASFAADYEGKLASLDAAGLLAAVQRYEQIDIIAGRVMSFAGLRYYQLTIDADRAKFLSDCQDRITAFTTPLVFYGLEFNRLDEGHLAGLLAADAGLAPCPGIAGLAELEKAEALGIDEAGDAEAIVQLTDIDIIRCNAGHIIGLFGR